MARRPEGWTLYPDRRTGIQIVRFTWAGVRYTRSTGESGTPAAQVEAARIYAAVTSGEVCAQPHKLDLYPPLDILAAEWLVAISGEVRKPTLDSYRMHARVHWIPYFGTFEEITPERIGEYTRARLRHVTAHTVKKERTSLRRFLDWACGDDAPRFPRLPKRAEGTSHSPQRRVDLTADEVALILANLPYRSRQGVPVKAYFQLMYETGLRRSTLNRLRTPRHYAPGQPGLTITRDIDKSAYARELPLTPAAREALDSVCPEEGLIFSGWTFKGWLRRAAKAAGLPPEKARHVSNHDLRHARLTHLANGPRVSLPALGYLAGHKHATTTALYVHPARAEAEKLLSGDQTGDHR